MFWTFQPVLVDTKTPWTFSSETLNPPLVEKKETSGGERQAAPVGTQENAVARSSRGEFDLCGREHGAALAIAARVTQRLPTQPWKPTSKRRGVALKGAAEISERSKRLNLDFYSKAERSDTHLKDRGEPSPILDSSAI